MLEVGRSYELDNKQPQYSHPRIVFRTSRSDAPQNHQATVSPVLSTETVRFAL